MADDMIGFLAYLDIEGYIDILDSQEKKKFREMDIGTIRKLVLLHDLGKIGVPNKILNYEKKPEGLAAKCIKYHPIISAKLIELIVGLSEDAHIVRLHHKACNGVNEVGLGSYPDEGELLFITKALQVVDAYDVIVSRVGLREAKALKRLESEAGKNLDRELVAAYIEYKKL